jgi:hypothetical protein
VEGLKFDITEMNESGGEKMEKKKYKYDGGAGVDGSFS